MKKNKELKKLLGEKDSFAMDLADYQSDYHQLLAKRGFDEDFADITDWANQPITEKSIADCLRYFYGLAPIGLLLYFYEAGQMKIWLLDQEGFQFSSAVDISEKAFLQLSADLGAGLNISAYEATRKPYKRGLESSDEDFDSEVDLDDVVNQLSNVLFPAGLSERLLNKKTEHLIIVPALNMQQLPFAILRPFEDQSLLIDKWSYSIAASIFDIAKLILRKKTETSRALRFMADETFLLVGNPQFSTKAKWVLPSLPGAEDEVKAISGNLSIPAEQVLIGSDAILPVIKEKSKNASLLYFATHGIADPDDPLDGSGLFLTPSESDPLGFWTARDIQSQDLSAVLVVLSACQTGLGQAQDAGMIGLSRAFHLAGAENILMSLWSVDDSATNSLMQIFMEEMQEMHTFFPSEPLRQAMLEYRKLHPEAGPVLWASFSTFGIPY